MIKDKELSAHLISVMFECSKQINEKIREVKRSCSDDEFKNYRREAGFVMGYIYTEIVAPLCRQHPELEPDELKPPTANGDD